MRPLDSSHRRSPGRAGYPIISGGLSADDILRKAMGVKPPEHDPEPPKASKAKRKKKSQHKKLGGK